LGALPGILVTAVRFNKAFHRYQLLILLLPVTDRRAFLSDGIDARLMVV
jgi:hypothetical protein